MNDWLEQVQEEIIEPALPICDPHHHLWDYPGSRYLLDELLADTGSGHHVVATVFVECGAMYRADGPEHLRPVGETEFVQGIAAMSAPGGYGATRAAAGIVGHADLSHPRCAETLDAHLAASPNRFRGIRHSASWDPHMEIRNSHSGSPPHLYLRDDFRRGFAELAPRNLSFDAWLYHPQLLEFIDLARAFPDTTMILDHFGGPLGIGPYAGRGDEIFSAWCEQIKALADCPNVYAKLGGINMKVNGFGWHRRELPATSDELIDETDRWYWQVIDHFGPQRCMFESNFPVDRVSCSYAVLWNAFKKLSRELPAAARQALFHDTAMQVYRL